ncbi:S-adenosyl-L-methionine-dependent methyltransferase [Exidia glandulosa HHB12029]|uniref:S-adenosyl-L-methionine-dependent methyltransferase n=1 Tax=Exidia glandulosa HHB12029 TaxID=1314781 RepID=A0A165D564_EXIGL|nr:S-adenosyl-L-methionine-dependent methyltransferase [Exidia glandulosa HHB12029]
MSSDAPRFYNDSKAIYLLPADSEEGRRLNAQYLAIQHSVGGKVVFPPVPLADGDAVLDCATGTGAWTLDLAVLIPPTVSIASVDVSPHLFPKVPPPNVKFEQHSVLSLPAEWSGRFTLVHQSLLAFALRTEEWQKDLQELYRVTKPGGWVQLCEVSWPDMVPNDELPFSRYLRGIHYKLAEMRGLDVYCGRNLEQRTKDAGFQNVEATMSRIPMGKQAGDGPQNSTYSGFSYFTGAMREHALAHGLTPSPEVYDAATAGLLEEWNSTPNTHISFFWVWGQRPL